MEFFASIQAMNPINYKHSFSLTYSKKLKG